tara:strand:- start:202 stop:549 length:348 start_codon:yes stop_codon:yes gene_type:complete
MTEKQYEEALFALGCKDVTSKVQKKNGTTAFRMPDGVNMITEHKTGYIRRIMLSNTGRVSHCYQLNPQYKADFQSIGYNGKLYKGYHQKRTLIWSRKTRLKKLFLYTIKALNNEG